MLDIGNPVPATSEPTSPSKDVQVQRNAEEPQNIQLTTEPGPETNDPTVQQSEPRPNNVGDKSYAQYPKSPVVRTGIGRFLNEEDW